VGGTHSFGFPFEFPFHSMKFQLDFRLAFVTFILSLGDKPSHTHTQTHIQSKAMTAVGRVESAYTLVCVAVCACVCVCMFVWGGGCIVMVY